MRHPEVYAIQDAAFIFGGKIAREVFFVMYQIGECLSLPSRWKRWLKDEARRSKLRRFSPQNKRRSSAGEASRQENKKPRAVALESLQDLSVSN